MERAAGRRADDHNRGIRDYGGDLWEVELGRRGDATVEDRADAPGGQVVFCRKPDGFAFTVRIPAGLTLGDYEDDALVAMIEERLSGPPGRRVG